MAEADFTRDAFLGGRLRLRQPARGFRSGLDAVLLAAAIAARTGQTALEAGAGAGVASLCLAHRLAGVSVTGLEIDADLVALANANAAENGLGDRVRFLFGAVESPPVALRGQAFDLVFANPPFLEAGEALAADDPGRGRARLGPQGTLGRFVDFCVRRVGSGGWVTILHRADRLDRLLAAIDGRLGALTLFPLWPRAGLPAKRVIIAGAKGSRAPLTLSDGLVLHDASGAYTPEAEAILRHGAALPLVDRPGPIAHL